MKKQQILIAVLLVLCSCATVQSVIKSTFPYTTTFTISRDTPFGKELSITEAATSFDQSFSKSGNTATKIHQVRITSAKLQSKDPSDFNIGNLTSVKFYMAKADGSGEILVASRSDITTGAGHSLTLDIDNNKLLDDYVREREVKIRMVYVLRNHIDSKTNLRLAIGLSASPNK